MTMTLTVRDVPEEVRDALAGVARRRGQSLQSYLLSVLSQQAAFSRNAQLLSEVADDLAGGGGAQADAPDAAELLAQDRPAQTGRGQGRRRSQPAA